MFPSECYALLPCTQQEVLAQSKALRAQLLEPLVTEGETEGWCNLPGVSCWGGSCHTPGRLLPHGTSS
jgi:hypothetical protein